MFITRTLHGPGTPVAAAAGHYTGVGADETVVASGRSVTLWRLAGPCDAEPLAARVLDMVCVPGAGLVRNAGGRRRRADNTRGTAAKPMRRKKKTHLPAHRTAATLWPC